MDEQLIRLREALSPFAYGDLASGIGALQLVPVNAERQPRFDRLAALVYSLDRNVEGPDLSPGRWRSILNTPPVTTAVVASQEDPAEDLFTGALSFIGGSYVVFPGIAEQSVEIARLLLKAVVLSAEPMPDEYVAEIQALTYGVLRLSDAVAARAGLRRGVQPESTTDRQVVLPPAEQFKLLKKAVTFDEQELNDLLDPVPIDALDPLTATEPLDLDPNDEANLSLPYQRPLLRIGDTWHVAVPSGLLVGLRHRVIIRAQELGLVDELVDRYRAATHSGVARSLRWMGWSELEWGMNDSPEWAIESFWAFDADKVAHVLVAVDDFADYEVQQPFGNWTPTFIEELDGRLATVRDRLGSSLEATEAVFSVLVLQGAGRQSAIPLPAGGKDNYETMVVWQPDLAVIARFEVGDPVALWKFARARSRVRLTTSVVAWNILDEYGAYRDHRHSFYISDEAPTHIYLDPTFGAAVRFEDAERFDFHGVPRPDGEGIMEVQKRWEGSQMLIYSQDPVAMDRLEFLVEGSSLPFWVRERDAGNTAESRDNCFELCDAIAYWISESAEAIEVVVEGLDEVLDEIQLWVSISDPQAWGVLDTVEPDDNWVEVTESASGQIELVFAPAAQLALGGPDNAGERELLRRVLEGLAAVAATLGYHPEIDIDAAVEEAAPLGVKKKVMLIDTSANIRLTPGDLPPLRMVNDADIEQLLDETGPAVADKLTLSEGPIEEESRSQVLNAIVELHFDELAEIVAELSPEGLLARLVGHHEQVVRAYYEQRLLIPTQLACFGSDTAYLEDIQERADRLMRADQAIRFLIEYVAAQPPSGLKALSVTTLDRLMALSSEMINKGMLSDAVYYGLADVAMQILPSGRVGTDKEGRYVLGVESFRQTQARHDVSFAHDYFSKHWQSDTETDKPPEVEKLDAVSDSEFGFTITELAYLIGDLLNVGLQQGAQEPKTLPLATAIEVLAESLDVTEDKTEQMIKALSLEARAAFIPDEDQVDVFPWRFNRNLSYVRRPLLVWSVNGEATLIWGIRHLDRIGPNLLNLIHSARLKAKSPEMRSYIGTMRTRENEAFNDQVADILATNPQLIVQRRVEKVGQTRIERSPGQPIGDIDVLVIDPRRRRITAIEAKDFEQARTPYELANEIEKLFEGEDSTIRHHMERIEWLQEHTKKLLEWLEVDPGNGRWIVEGIIVVSRPLVTPHFADSPLPVIDVDALLRLGQPETG